jgi:hypothetical protein
MKINSRLGLQHENGNDAQLEDTAVQCNGSSALTSTAMLAIAIGPRNLATKSNWALPTTDVRSGHTLAAHNDHQLSSSINSLSQNS